MLLITCSAVRILAAFSVQSGRAFLALFALGPVCRASSFADLLLFFVFGRAGAMPSRSISSSTKPRLRIA
jgi:hypothetical protein